MANMLATAIDSQLSRDGFNIVEKINEIANDFAARGFSQPSGPMYQAIEELCASRMEQTTDTAIVVYKNQLAQRSVEPEHKGGLIGYLQIHLNSLAASALESYNRPASQSSKAMMDSKVRSLLAKAERA